jgi:hypothetical protein
MSWKHGFLKDSTIYKKCDRYKKTLEEKIEEKVNTLFENKFRTFIQNLSQEHGSPPLHLLAPQAAKNMISQLIRLVAFTFPSVE